MSKRWLIAICSEKDNTALFFLASWKNTVFCNTHCRETGDTAFSIIIPAHKQETFLHHQLNQQRSLFCTRRYRLLWTHGFQTSTQHYPTPQSIWTLALGNGFTICLLGSKSFFFFLRLMCVLILVTWMWAFFFFLVLSNFPSWESFWLPFSSTLRAGQFLSNLLSCIT